MASLRSTSPESASETVLLLETLKRILKDRKVSYRVLALKLEMSEANVKRIFSQMSLSVSTLVRMCSAVDLTLSDLVGAAARNSKSSYQISPEAEAFFVQNFDAFIVYRRIGFQQLKCDLRVKDLGTSEAKWIEILQNLGLIKIDRAQNIRVIGRGALHLSSTSALRNEMERRWAPWLIERVLRNRNLDDHQLRVFSTGLRVENLAAFRREVADLFERYRQIGWLDQQPGKVAVKDVGVCFAMAPFRVGNFSEDALPTTILPTGSKVTKRSRAIKA